MTMQNSHGKMPLTHESLLTEPLVDLDFGPFKHPKVPTWKGTWHREMVKHLGDSIRRYRERRILTVSWILAALIGVFGNLFASSLFGRPEYGNGFFAGLFLAAALASVLVLFIYFPPAFTHTFQVFYGKDASDAKMKLFEAFEQKTGALLQSFSELDGKIDEFLRVYNLLLIRDCLRAHPLIVTRVTEARNPEVGFESWVTVGARSRFAWMARKIEQQLWNELGLVCELFATTIVPIGPAYVDEKTPLESVQKFDLALSSIDFDELKPRIVKQIAAAVAK
jgi:hypothetical protein